MSSRPSIAARRAGRTTLAGGAAAKAPSRRASMAATRAGKQRERHDVPDIGGGIGPGRLADRRAQRRLLQGDEKLRRLGQHHRSSTVLPSMVMRSARISSFSTVEG